MGKLLRMALWARQADTPAAQGLSLLLASILLLLLLTDLPPSCFILALSHTHPPPRRICLCLPNCPACFFTPTLYFLAVLNYFSFFHYLRCDSCISPRFLTCKPTIKASLSICGQLLSTVFVGLAIIASYWPLSMAIRLIQRVETMSAAVSNRAVSLAV